jgi:hypothetical protein
MALQLALSESSTDVGAAFPAAYARVIFGRTFSETCIVTVNFYADEQARREDKREIQQRHYECLQSDVSALVEKADHLHAPFYRYLKSLPEFAGAVDV